MCALKRERLARACSLKAMNQKRRCTEEDRAELEIILQKHLEIHEKLKAALKSVLVAALRSAQPVIAS